MSDMQDRIARLAAEAQQRADVAGTQATWQEGRAHGLREAAAVATAAADTRTLRDDVRDYLTGLEARAAESQTKSRDDRSSRLSPHQLAIGEVALLAKRDAWRQVAEDLRGLLAADEPEESDGDE